MHSLVHPAQAIARNQGYARRRASAGELGRRLVEPGYLLPHVWQNKARELQLAVAAGVLHFQGSVPGSVEAAPAIRTGGHPRRQSWCTAWPEVDLASSSLQSSEDHLLRNAPAPVRVLHPSSLQATFLLAAATRVQGLSASTHYLLTHCGFRPTHAQALYKCFFFKFFPQVFWQRFILSTFSCLLVLILHGLPGNSA